VHLDCNEVIVRGARRYSLGPTTVICVRGTQRKGAAKIKEAADAFAARLIPTIRDIHVTRSDDASQALLGVGGVAFIVENRLNVGVDHSVGIAFSVAALISLVGGTILFKKFAPTAGLWVGTCVQSLSGGLTLLPFALMFERIGDVVPSWHLLAALAYLILFVSVAAYLLWFHLLNVSGATAASSYHFVMPPLGLLFGWLLLGEHVALSDLLGNRACVP